MNSLRLSKVRVVTKSPGPVFDRFELDCMWMIGSCRIWVLVGVVCGRHNGIQQCVESGLRSMDGMVTSLFEKLRGDSRDQKNEGSCGRKGQAVVKLLLMGM